MEPVDRGKWASRTGFILAAAGSAVGLGNIWKFPYITGENGGGLFVLIYLVCIALVGLPIMMAEIMIGRAAQKQPVAAFHALHGGRTAWAGIGWFGVATGFVILSYYIVVAGWAMDYTLKSVVNIVNDIEESAQLEGKEYRAYRARPDMVADIAQWDAQRSASDEVDLKRRDAKPSDWREFQRFNEVIARGKQASERAVARTRLLEDAKVAEHVAAAELVQEQIEAIEARHLAEAHAALETLSDQEIRDRGETIHRRAAIAKEVGSRFGSLATDGWTSAFWATLFMLITILIVAGGISKGIERTCRVLMPTLLVLIVVMVVYGFFQPGFGEALRFVFAPDASKLKPSGVLEALGHAFFTLSLGMGAMITYGSYQATKGALMAQSVAICLLDTLVALLACMMMFPIIFSYGQEASAGPGLVFVSMPLAFAEIGTGGMLLSMLFFGLLVFAALTSAISLLEVVISFFIDEKGWSRHRAAWILGGVVLLFGMPSAFASSEAFLFGSWKKTYELDFFSTLDYLASNWMLPVGGLLISIYAGWVMPKRLREQELSGLAPSLIHGWLFLIRFLAPLVVTLVLLDKVEILDADEFFHGGWFG